MSALIDAIAENTSAVRFSLRFLTPVIAAFLLLLVLLGVSSVGALADDAAATPAQASSSPSFSVAFYADADRETKLVDLTSDGSTYSGWPYDAGVGSPAQRHLGIAVSNLSPDSRYRIVVSMDPIIYIDGDPIEDSIPPANTTIVETVSNTFTVNSTGQYPLSSNSMKTLVYEVDAKTGGLSFGLPMRFERNLWNKQNGGNLGNGTDPLVRVCLQEKAPGSDEFVTMDGYDLKMSQATTVGSISYQGKLYRYLVGEASVDVSVMGVDDSMRLVFHHFYSNNYDNGHYADSVSVKINVPSCEVGGVTHRMTYSNFKFATSVGSVEPESVDYDPETGVLTVTASKRYFETSKMFEVILKAPEALKSVEEKFSFTGSIAATMDGATVTKKTGISITLDNTKQASFTTKAADGRATAGDQGFVQFLGALAMKNNSASVASTDLLVELEFDTNGTNSVLVTTVNMMCGAFNETKTVRYTLVKKDGTPAFPDGNGNNQEFTTTVTYAASSSVVEKNNYNNLCCKFTRNDLLPEHRGGDYYIKTLSYTMESLPANTYAYNSSGHMGTSSAGTFWGYVPIDSVPSVMPRHVMNVHELNEDLSAGPLLRSIEKTTQIGAGGKVPFGLRNASVSKTAVQAGDSVTIGGRIEVSGYPYVSSNNLKDVRLGIVLPAGIRVNASSITAQYRKGGSLSVESVASSELPDGSTRYIVDFDQESAIGWYNEQLSYLDAGNYIQFSVQLNSERTISSQTLYLKEHVFAFDANAENGSSAAWEKYLAADAYDLNGDGSTANKIARFADADTSEGEKDVAVTFQAAPAELDVSTWLSKNGTSHGNSAAIDSFADAVTYNINISCTDGGTAEKFLYILPVGSASICDEDGLVSKAEFSLKLLPRDGMDPVSVTNRSGGTAFKVQYSTNTTAKTYDEAAALTDWFEELPEGKTWADVDVTFVKVLACEDVIVNGSECTVSFDLGYDGIDEEYPQFAGMKVQWFGCGYYYYEIGSNSGEAAHPSELVTTTLVYTPEKLVNIVLTAANGAPQGEGASKTASITLPQFLNAQTYSITQIVPHGVTLKDETYDFATASSTEANEVFRITVSVKDSEEKESASPFVPIKEEGKIVGALDGKIAPEFTFAIENADALSDIVTERYVDLTLIGSNGVIVPVRITVKRELAVAGSATPAIVSGKRYSPFGGADPITVSDDSAFTVQVVTECVPSLYEDRALTFGSPLVSGTTIAMIDWTNPDVVGYYHYEVGSAGASSIPLTSFKVMGGSASYEESEVATTVSECFLFVIDLPDGEWRSSSAAGGSVSLSMKHIEETQAVLSTALQYSYVDGRTFSLSASRDGIALNESDAVLQGSFFDLSYTSSCEVTDSRYTRRNFAMVVSPGDGCVFPETARLSDGVKSYSLTSEGVFIVPLGSVQDGGGLVSLSYESGTGEASVLQCELWASATITGEKPFMGEKVAGPVTVSVAAEKLPSLNVVSMSPSRLLEREDGLSRISIQIKTADVSSMTVEVQKKVGVSYVTQTAVLESVNGTTGGAQGVFSVAVSEELTLGLSAQTDPGTYRILLKAMNAYGDAIEVPYNFIVK